MPLSGPVSYYRDTSQYVKVKFWLTREIPDNYTIALDFGANNLVFASSAYTSLSPLDTTQPVKFNYAADPAATSTTSRILTIMNIGGFSSNQVVYVTCRVLLSSLNTVLNVQVAIDENPANVVPPSANKALYASTTASAVTLLTNAFAQNKGDLVVNGLNNFDGVVDIVQIPASKTATMLNLIFKVAPADVTSTSELEIFAPTSLKA